MKKVNKESEIVTEIYDPVMTPLDNLLVESLGSKCIKQNENCKRIANESTLFFVPHGDLVMYGNLLETNYENKAK